MKKSIQPKDYDFVVFADEQAKFSFLTRSTAKSEETIKWTDGKEYPLVKMQISSASHCVCDCCCGSTLQLGPSYLWFCVP